jgi:hypothetical protein
LKRHKKHPINGKSLPPVINFSAQRHKFARKAAVFCHFCRFLSKGLPLPTDLILVSGKSLPICTKTGKSLPK